MRTLKIAALASVAVAALTSATLAADPIVMVDTPPIIDDVSFGWDGPYAGVFVLGTTSGGGGIGVGVNLGVNMSADALVFGLEGDAAWVSGPTMWQAQVVGRLGAALSDDAIIYGLAGIGADGLNGAYVPVGIGAEFMMADNMSLKAQYEFHWDLAAPGANAHVGKVGVNFHF
jgi:opacity protein-like surface antigen